MVSPGWGPPTGRPELRPELRPSALGPELTFHERHALELEGNVVLSGENVNGAAGLREQVQVQLQLHDCF